MRTGQRHCLAQAWPRSSLWNTQAGGPDLSSFPQAAPPDPSAPRVSRVLLTCCAHSVLHSPGCVRDWTRMFSHTDEICYLCLQVSKNGLTNSVFTLYELVSGDDTENEGKAGARVLEQVFRARWIGACKQLIVRLHFCRLNILKSQMQTHRFPPLAHAAPKAFIILQEHPPL